MVASLIMLLANRSALAQRARTVPEGRDRQCRAVCRLGLQGLQGLQAVAPARFLSFSLVFFFSFFLLLDRYSTLYASRGSSVAAAKHAANAAQVEERSVSEGGRTGAWAEWYER